jgi:hypothetical protein
MSYIYNKHKINNDVDNIHKIDIISLNKFFLERGDKLLSRLLFDTFYILPDKENFQKNYIKILEVYSKKNDIADNDNLVMIPKDYYNDDIIQGIIDRFGYRWGILGLINPHAKGLDKYIEKYIIKHEDYQMLQYISPELENYYELCEFLIKKMSSSIKYVDEYFDRYEELALLSLSVSNGISFFLIPYGLRSEKLCIDAVNKNAFNILYVPNTINNYYSLMKIAYQKDKSIIGHHRFPEEYIDMLKNDFPEDFNLQESKSLLKEGITDEVYHFTSLWHFIKIMDTNIFRLSDLEHDLGIDNTPLKKYKYYMSVSRTASIKKGYGYNKYKNNRYIVRIKLDGRKLSQTYKGLPINYWNYGQKQELNKKTHREFEYEDRILSNKPTIENFSKYILKIDIIKIKNPSHDLSLEFDENLVGQILQRDWYKNSNIIKFISDDISRDIFIHENKSLLKEYISREVRKLLKEKISL